ncbi:MAG: histone deacetylase [Halobacteriovoraceae bacterium]|nr:histone deacetylase [Halobacteriovoraceae bacterium]
MSLVTYHPDLDTQFSRYGIQIPIADERASKTFALVAAEFSSLCQKADLELIKPLGREDLLLVHQRDFIERLFDRETASSEIIKAFELKTESGEYHRYDPTSATVDLLEMLPSVLLQGGASYYAMERALEDGFHYFLGGGMHHAMSFGGRGFCLINDIVIGLKKLQKEEKIKTAWVIDVDAHKGDGTAELTASDSSISTLSIHMAKGWPLDGPQLDSRGELRPQFIASDVDIPVLPINQDSYNMLLEEGLYELEEQHATPELCIIVHGADAYEGDQLASTHHLNLTLEQLKERDQLLDRFLLEREIPRVYLMAGGYGGQSYRVYTQFLKGILPDFLDD